jgi:cleavage stimulation factor subunit 2
VATFESMGGEACKALKEQVPGLAEAMEQVQRLLDMAAADDAAEEDTTKKRASAAEESEHRAKLSKLEEGRKATTVRGIVPCF